MPLPSYQQSAQMLVDIARSLGVKLDPSTRVLDFGCGRGQLVAEFLKMPLDTYGVDVKAFWEDNPALTDKSRFRVSESNPYRIPWEDNYFDFITSTSVFEHVRNHEECFQEIHPVLKPGGSTMHLFPGPWTLPVEPRMHVPFASMIHSEWWLSLWAFLGIRNEFQKGKHWREVARLNKEYCETGIHYVPRKKVRKLVQEIFGNVKYPKKEYIRYSPGGAGKLGRALPIPGYASLVFACREQLIFMRKF